MTMEEKEKILGLALAGVEIEYCSSPIRGNWQPYNVGDQINENYHYRRVKPVENVHSKVFHRVVMTTDDGTMGFHDYTTRKEPYGDFLRRAMDFVNETASYYTAVNIGYPSEDLIVVTWRYK